MMRDRMIHEIWKLLFFKEIWNSGYIEISDSLVETNNIEDQTLTVQ